MDREQWQSVQRIFTAAVAAESPELEELLAAECSDDAELRAEVESLLRAHRRVSATTFIERPAADLAVGDPDAVVGMSLPARVDRYRLVSTIGLGGMGDVFLAYRADDEFQKQVAVKLLRRDLGAGELVRRFRRERQILANLEHPNIARLIDGGSMDDGRPYLVMELVDGEPIDAYCGREGLSLARRLRLFRKVCGAVHFAHQNLVVHRDLKPSNILVDRDGEPKLLDFGIAKLIGEGPGLADGTLPGGAGMTPDYASPEQVRGAEISTASDVYSLGVVLYELLTGLRPYELGPVSAEERIRRVSKETVSRPSTRLERAVAERKEAPQAELRTRVRQLRGDLDNIVLKAMAKEPERRYPSADELGRDLQRHLLGFPVSARADTWLYRTGRFVRRHRIAVAAAAASLAGLIALTVGLAWQRVETLRERDRAAEVSQSFIDLFRHADPTRTRGESITAREMLDRGRERIARLGSRPRLQADLYQTMAEAYDSLGLHDPAVELARAALATRERVFGAVHGEVASVLQLLGTLEGERANLEEGESLLRRAAAMRRELHGGAHPDTAMADLALATLLHRSARQEEARALYASSIAALRGTERRRDLAKALTALATIERDFGEYEGANRHQNEAISLLRAEAPDGLDADLGWALINAGNLARHQGNWELANGHLTEAHGLFERLFAGPHPRRATVANHLGLLVQEMGKLKEAEVWFRESLEMRRTVFGDEHTAVAQARNNLARVLRRAEKLDEAEALFEEALAVYRDLLPAEHRDLAPVLGNLGELHLRRGESERAQAYFEEALAIYRHHFGDSHRYVAVMLNNLASAATELGELKEAAGLQEQAVDSLRGALGSEHKDVAHFLYNLGLIHERSGDGESAAAAYRRAMEIADGSLPPQHELYRSIAAKIEEVQGAG